MLSDSEVVSLFHDTESDRVERKASAADSSKIKEAICAFSNDYPRHGRPGVVFVGQNDDLSCAKLTIDSRLLEVLGGWRSDGNILPFPSMAVRSMRIEGCDVAVVIVDPSENPPVRFNGRTWIRIGPRRAIATFAEETRLVERRQWQSLSFDAKGIGDATISDLSLALFQIEYVPLAFSAEAVAQNGRTIEEQLRALRFLDPAGRPTPAAILTVGVDPLVWLPGAYIQFLAVDGTELTAPIRDQKMLSGVIGDQLRLADELIDLLITTGTSIGSKRSEIPNYPSAALKQVVRNAVLHRSYEGSTAPVRFTAYSDRVEISSPGGAFGGVTALNFGNVGATAYRNPTLAEVMRNLGFVEKFGLGLQIVRKSMEQNGNPTPEFRVEEHFVHITIRARA